MKSWKIHLVWAAVTVATGVVVAQRSGSQRDLERRVEVAGAKPAAPATPERERRAEPLPEPEALEERTSPPGGEIDEFDDERPARFAGGGGRPGEGPPDGRKMTREEVLQLLKQGGGRGAWRAMRAVRDLESPEDKLAVLKEILASGDPRAKNEALRMLSELGGPVAVDLTVGVLDGDSPPWVRARAARALGQLGGPVAMAALDRAYQTPDLQIRTFTAAALRTLGRDGPHQEMVNELARMQDLEDGAKREDSAELLGRLGTASVLPYLTRSLSDSNSDVRIEAVRALGRTRLSEAVPLLEQASNDPEPEVAQNARRAIQRINGAPGR